MTHPLADRAIEFLIADETLRESVEYLLETQPDLRERLEPDLAVIDRVMVRQKKTFDDALEALLEYTHVYLRAQVSFMKTGAYSSSSFEDVFASVYDNEEMMMGTYLPGLFMTQLFWPIHAKVLARYEDRFLMLVGAVTSILEVGVGPGMTLMRALRRFPEASAQAVDVSRHSLAFAELVVESDRCRFIRGDATADTGLGTTPADMGTMGEILEHVAHPEKALKNFKKGLVKGGHGFITTVIDSNAIDHLYLFKSKEEIDGLIEAGGFDIVSSELIRPSDLRRSGAPGSDPTQYYYAIARAR